MHLNALGPALSDMFQQKNKIQITYFANNQGAFYDVYSFKLLKKLI